LNDVLALLLAFLLRTVGNPFAETQHQHVAAIAIRTITVNGGGRVTVVTKVPSIDTDS